MISFPNAKINLGLRIVGRRADGYHNLETVFYPIPLTDALEIIPAKGGEPTRLHCHGREVACRDEDNLVMRAFRLLESRCGIGPVEMHLYKRIPDGAGLGGGSSDAAHALVMLDTIFGLRLGRERLAELAATLGADCPFFVYNTPMSATGIGDVLRPASVSLAGRKLVLVKPPVSVSTREAYSRVRPAPAEVAVEQVTQWPVEMWDGALVNDFEPSVFALHPRLWAIKLSLLTAGADYAAMSGSGSAIFGIFKGDNVSADALEVPRGSEIFTLAL